MDDYTQAEAMIRRYKNSIKERDTWVESWQDCYDYALPGRTGFYDFVSGQSNVDKIYDSTASIATQEFASRIQAGLTPTFTKWFDFRAGQDIPEKNRAEVLASIARLENFLFISSGATILFLAGILFTLII